MAAGKRKNPFKSLVVSAPTSNVKASGRKQARSAFEADRLFGLTKIRKHAVPAVMDIKRLKRGRKKK